MVCDHDYPRHLIERFDNGQPESFWMCCNCGEVVGRYKKVNTCGYTFDAKNHCWFDGRGKVVTEYAEL